MHIQYYVDSLLLAGIQYTVQTFKSLLLIHKGVHIILKMLITQRDPDTIGPCFPNEPYIVFIQEIIQNFLKKQF